MAITLASKFSAKVDKRFTLKSRTSQLKGGNGYDWKGVNTVTVYDRPVVAMGDYSTTGSTRYGTPAELQNTTQDLTVTKDRAFTATIDKLNMQDTMDVMKASSFLKDQIDEVVVPEVDVYRLSVLSTRAGTTSSAVAITASNAYSSLLAAQEDLDNSKVPTEGRMAYCTPAYYNFLKLDNSFIQASDIAQDMLKKGQLGEVDGVAIFKAPTTYFPANTAFIMCNKNSMITVEKLTDYTIHENPPGINGSLIEGRIRYDAFVLDNKQASVYRHIIA